MKRLLKKITDTLADAALLEMGVALDPPAAKAGIMRETLEECLIEAAFAEAADYDGIYRDILRERQVQKDVVPTDKRRGGDTGKRFRHAA